MLGAPTLRLRGDYLAIVTLGFGEIIRIAAINNPTTSPTRPAGPRPRVPHPVHPPRPDQVDWGLDSLPYWYLLLVLIVIMVVLFYRLEGSRIGRAWAAIREDEVAAQATGINTTRVKLLAFAIGASTSGVAGVFFASQVGYFNPDNFMLAQLDPGRRLRRLRRHGLAARGDGRRRGAHLAAGVPQGPGAGATTARCGSVPLILLMMIFRPAG